MAVRWDDLASPATLRRADEVIVRLGSTVITRRQMITDLECDFMRSGRALTKRLARYQPKSARELARRLSLDEMLGIRGVGEMAAFLFGLVLMDQGMDPCAWADGKLKLATRYAKAKARKSKRQSRKSRRARVYPFRLISQS